MTAKLGPGAYARESLGPPPAQKSAMAVPTNVYRLDMVARHASTSCHLAAVRLELGNAAKATQTDIAISHSSGAR